MDSKKLARDPLPERQPSTGNRSWTVQGFMIWHAHKRHFTPPTDIVELNTGLVVLVEIAGMRSGDFKITLFDNHLVITGVRERPSLNNPAYHQVEIGFGEFRVEVLIPWLVNREEISASYRDGFLRIDLPRRESTQVQTVDVHIEEQD